MFVALLLQGYARFRQNEHAVIHPCCGILQLSGPKVGAEVSAAVGGVTIAMQ